MDMHRYFIRNLAANRFFELFLVSAIASILIIRFYLQLTGFPQLGGGGLHIAHMLWGGLLMLVAIIFLLGFLGRNIQNTAAILGGVGFGTFIDELGKFITHNNNYFFQPTIAIIYVIFVVLYLIFQTLMQHRNIAKSEYLANILEIIKEGMSHALSADDFNRATTYLAQAKADSVLQEQLTALLGQVHVASQAKEDFITKLRLLGRNIYTKVMRRDIFTKLVIIFFVAQALGIIAESIVDTVGVAHALRMNNLALITPKTLIEWGDVFSSTLSGIFVIVGVIRIFHSRLAAYRMFKIAVLISLLLTQFFLFYDMELSALYEFAWSAVTLLVLNIMIDGEVSAA